nr:MAG TPA: hypothetical protein [Caudoviricetes sp.]
MLFFLTDKHAFTPNLPKTQTCSIVIWCFAYFLGRHDMHVFFPICMYFFCLYLHPFTPNLLFLATCSIVRGAGLAENFFARV